ncbi:hypothetical protein Pme01_49380 [Planosporangium mesophilum]|uniref:Uncharacterized protein n=1 Tax=Planosporangium mesophilum TaxID=689768 RepID=A0A8J3X2W5_9ACTN|nr:hypothetical protein Pme01_49380 [Planosporangium mesophilum]
MRVVGQAWNLLVGVGRPSYGEDMGPVGMGLAFVGAAIGGLVMLVQWAVRRVRSRP